MGELGGGGPEARAQLRAFIAQMPGAVALVVGAEHVFVAASVDYQREANRPLVDRTFRDAFPELAGDGFVEELDRALATGDALHATRGASAWTVTPMRDGDGDGSVFGLLLSSTARTDDTDSMGQYRALAELSPDGIFVNLEGRIVYANPAVARMVGVASPSELIGRSPLEWIPEAQRAAVEARIVAVRAGGDRTAAVQQEFLRADGTTVEVEVVSSVVPWGGARAFQVLLHPLTDQRRTEAALARAHRRTNEILESIADGFYAVDREFRLTFVNARIAEIWRTSRETILGARMWDLLPDVDLEINPVCRLHREAMRDRRARTLETFSPFLRDWVAMSIYPSEDGGLSVHVREIGDRKRTEAALVNATAAVEREREQLARILAQAPFAVCVLMGPAHIVTKVNDLHRQVIGRRRLIGLPIREVFPEGGVQAAFDELDHTYRTGEPSVARELRFNWNRNGTVIEESFFDAVYHALRDSSGAVEGVIACFVEVTDSVRARKETEAALRTRDDFLSIASHELRTPLTTIALAAHGALHALRESGHSLPTVADDIRMLQRQGHRLELLVQGLLDVSLLTAGRLELDLEDVDLAELAGQVCERFAGEARKREAPITLRADSTRGRWDAFRLDQVLTNLVTNAIKYGSGRPVDVTIGAEGNTARIMVRDRGIGIAEKDQRRIFGRFERAVSDRHYGGLGLGLWIARQMVEAMAGSIRVDSALGDGSTFIVELPQ